MSKQNRLRFKDRPNRFFKAGLRKSKRLLAILPLVALQLMPCASCASMAKNSAPASASAPKPAFALEKGAKAVEEKEKLYGEWGGGACVLDKKSMRLTYLSTEPINGKNEVELELSGIKSKTEGLTGEPINIFCGDARTYIINQMSVTIAVGADRLFNNFDIIGQVGDELAGKYYVFDILSPAIEGLLSVHVRFENKTTEEGSTILDDKLFIYTKEGNLWIIPLVTPLDATRINFGSAPPDGDSKVVDYRGVVVLAKEGKETIVMTSGKSNSAGDIMAFTVTEDEQFSGEVKIEEKKDCLKVSIGAKSYRVVIPDEGSTKTAEVSAWKDKSNLNDDNDLDEGD